MRHCGGCTLSLVSGLDVNRLERAESSPISVLRPQPPHVPALAQAGQLHRTLSPSPTRFAACAAGLKESGRGGAYQGFVAFVAPALHSQCEVQQGAALRLPVVPSLVGRRLVRFVPLQQQGPHGNEGDKVLQHLGPNRAPSSTGASPGQTGPPYPPRLGLPWQPGAGRSLGFRVEQAEARLLPWPSPAPAQYQRLRRPLPTVAENTRHT
jgi:hypothetical protein